MDIHAIVLGATGMVGEGVLHMVLSHPDVRSVLVIGRRPCGAVHPKLKELIHHDFTDFSSVRSSLTGYNACYFCLGTTSIGKSEEEYRRISYDYTLHLARTLAPINPDMTFCYVSGEGTDSSEQGRQMWARVKGKTENDLSKLPFKAVYLFRPGFIKPIKGMKNTLSFAKPLLTLYPLLSFLLPKHGCTLEDIGTAMINVTKFGFPTAILENPDITRRAQSEGVL